MPDQTLPETEQPRGRLALRTLAMPADANINGDIFGGWVLAQMDLAGGIAAGARAQGRVATVAIDALAFVRPVAVGDVLSIYAHVERVGRTSMAILLEAWVRRNRAGRVEKVTAATFTFVAIDDHGRPRPVPPEAAPPPEADDH
jgi:acyl-CoA thioesterase YciA